MQLVKRSILTIDDAFKSIVEFFSTKSGWVSFHEIIPRSWRNEPGEVKSAVATTFAASLELVKSGELKIKQDFPFKTMKIRSNAREEIE